MNFIAVDPGTGKCGLAVFSDGICIWREVSPAKDFSSRLVELSAQYDCRTVALGDGTGRVSYKRFTESLSLECIVVDERNSTLDARLLYFKNHPPTGLRRLIPLCLQVPPVAYDGFVAEVIGLRFLESRLAASNKSKQ